MKIFLTFFALVILSDYVDASIVDVFKDEQGRTKWQHVANFSGSVLILLLLFSMLGLLLSRFKLRSKNKELREIKNNLENTVRKRTENLNKSNRLLQETNTLLETEVSERKATQNYLRSILTSMPSMLIGLSDELKITQWNSTAASIAGLSELDVLGKDLWEVYPAITVDPEQVKKVLEGGESEIVKHRQRGQYYFDITIYPLEQPQRGVVLIIENVTQRSLAENMLIQRDKMASLGELAATMAHDINMPLQGILKDVSEVLEELDGKSVQLASHALLADAVERGQQASAVVNNLLAFSGSHGNEKQSADLAEIMEHCVDLAGNVISNPSGLKFRDVSLKTEYQSDLPKLDCYVAELQQVFLSVIRYACHALSEARDSDGFEPQIILSVYAEFDTLWVKVEHNGQSLTAEEQQEVFEPFVQHTTPVNPKPVLPGNRLSFSYFIVTEHHDGEMAVTSGADGGATFHIQFQLP